MAKYFLAIVPPTQIFNEIESLKKEISEKYFTKGALLSPAHITLHMPFEFEEGKEQKLIGCLSEFSFNSCFEINLKGYDCFEPRVVFINVEKTEELNMLQKQLVSQLKKNLNIFNQADDMRGFHPHLTIAYRDLKKPVFYQIWEEYQNKSFEKTFTCQSFWLLKKDEKQWKLLQEFSFKTT
jgi:2'-5' RNA ligase